MDVVGRRSGRVRTAAALAPVLVVLLAGCDATAGQQPAEVTPSAPAVAWEQIDVADAEPPLQLLGTDGGQVLVAAASDELPTPAMTVLDLAAGGTTEVAVTADSYYGARALWRSVVLDGEDVWALGARSGGAHGNARWSTWSGNLHDGVSELPVEPVETFGGPRAGTLAGIAVLDGVPVIVGSRSVGDDGLDIVLWTLHGDGDGDDGGSGWQLLSSAGTPLAAAPGVQPLAAAVVGAADEVMIVGSVTRIGDGGVRTGAAVWTAASLDGPWRQLELPADGAVVTADAAGCDADRCVVTGRSDGSLVAWEVAGPAVRVLDLPEVELGRVQALPPVFMEDSIVLLAPRPGAGMVLTCADGEPCASRTGPPGSPVAIASVGDSLAVATDTEGRLRLYRSTDDD